MTLTDTYYTMLMHRILPSALHLSTEIRDITTKETQAMSEKPTTKKSTTDEGQSQAGEVRQAANGEAHPPGGDLPAPITASRIRDVIRDILAEEAQSSPNLRSSLRRDQ